MSMEVLLIIVKVEITQMFIKRKIGKEVTVCTMQAPSIRGTL